MTVIGRLAPTPSGYLHLGNLLNFVICWSLVKRNQGLLALRIDDHDQTRTRDHFVEQIFSDLNWLGFDWEQGPRSLEEWRVHSQIAKKEKYWQQLLGYQDQLFACECSRKDLPLGEDYPGTCLNKNLQFKKGSHSLRLKSGESHPILWRKDDQPAYHFVSVIEDRTLNSNLIVRGADLFEATKIQLEIERSLFQSEIVYGKSRFYHHQLILDSEGKKISKSEGGESLKVLRQQGKEAADVFTLLSERLGIKPCVELNDFLKTDWTPFLEVKKMGDSSEAT